MIGSRAAASATRAVFFDVDFTLIFPGPMLQGEGYVRFCAEQHVDVDAALFDRAVRAASFILDEVEDPIYDASSSSTTPRRSSSAWADAAPVW